MSRIPASAPRRWQERIRESRLGTVLVLAVTAAIVSAGAYLVDRPPAAATRATTAVGLTGAGNGAAPNIGSAAQDFTVTTLDGKTASLSSDRGKAVWLTFGATWCATCVAEAPDVEAVFKKFAAYRVIGIPAHYFIDASGVPRSVKTGALSPEIMAAALAEIS